MRHVKFSDVITRANTKEDRFNTDKIYYVGGEHIDSEELLVNNKGLIKGSTIGPMFYCGFKAGQVLFVTRNPHLRKCSAVDFDGICSEKTFVLETKDPSVLLQSYLMVIMQSDALWEYCEENKSGGVNYFINWSTLAEYEFDLPELSEQEVIAKKLWAAYEVKQSYVNMIKATDEMVKSQFIEMFKDSPKMNLGDLATFVNGSAFKPGEWALSGLPIVRIQNLTQEDAPFNYFGGNPAQKVQISDGDVLVSWSATLGVFTWNKGDAILNQHIFKVVFDKKDIDKEFFIYTAKVALETMGQLAHGSTMRHVVKKDFDSTQVAYPKIEEQRLFSSIMQQADKSKFELKQSIEAIDKVIKSLINENL